MTPPSYQVPDSFRNRNWDQPVDGSWSEDDENGYYEDPEPGTAHERSSAPRRRPSRASTINSTGTIRTNPSPHRLGRHSNHHRDVGDGRATAPPAPRRRQLTTGTSSAAHDDRWQGSNVHYAGEQMAQIRNPGYYKSGPGAPPNVNPMMSPLQGMQDPFSRGPGPYQGAPYQGGPYPGPPYQTPPSSYDYSAPRGPMLPPSSSRPPTHRPTPRDPGVFEPTSSASRPKVRVRSSSTNRPRVQVRVQAARRPSPPPPPEPRIEPRVERLEQENQALRERLELTQEQCRIEMEAAAQHRQELDAQRAAEEEAAQRNAERNRRHDREHRERSSQSRTRRSGSRGAPNAPRVVRINHSDLREARPKVIVEVGKSMEPGPAPNDSRMEDQQRQARDHMATNELRGLLGGYDAVPRDLEMQRTLEVLRLAQLLAPQQTRPAMVPAATLPALLDQLRISNTSWHGSQVPGMAMTQPDFGYLGDSSHLAALPSLLSILVKRVDSMDQKMVSVDQKMDTLSQQRLAILEGELLDDESYHSPLPSRRSYRGSELGDPESTRSRASTGSVFSDPRSTTESGISRGAQSSARGGTATEHRRTVPRPHQDSRRAMSRHQTPGPNEPSRSERFAPLPSPLPYPPSTTSFGPPMPAYAEEIHDEDLEASRRGPRSSGRRFPDGRTEIGSQTQRSEREGRRAETTAAANTSSRRRDPSAAGDFFDGDDGDSSDDDDEYFSRVPVDREIPRRRTSGIYPRPAPASVPDAPNPLKTKPLAY